MNLACSVTLPSAKLVLRTVYYCTEAAVNLSTVRSGLVQDGGIGIMQGPVHQVRM